MSDKKTHFGRAGEYFAMSELLLRGWNVAIPVVDVGDDVFIIDDRDKTTWRVQVKTSATEPSDARDGLPAGRVRATFNLSREQLRAEHAIELFYMLMTRVADRWRLLVIPRAELLEIHDTHVDGGRTRRGPGRKPQPDEAARTDSLLLTVEIEGDEAKAWGASLRPYLDQWPASLQVVEGGPGSAGASAAPTPPPVADRAPSPDPEK
jgi:hypothetical protein